MKKIMYVWKPVGITPLEAIQVFKNENPEYKREIISYAGRLDPMAEGILILLIGEENKNRDKYLKFDKEYEAEIIIGISTDTYDGLGLITSKNFKNVSKKEIQNKLKEFLGKQNQKYPPYSSKTVDGKPLYWWARKKRIKEIIIPEHIIKINSLDLINMDSISMSELKTKMINQVKKINGDFRQEEIIKSWGNLKNDKKLLKIKIIASCSSGTYIRGIANDLGKRLGIDAFAYSIIRTRIGDKEKSDCLILGE